MSFLPKPCVLALAGYAAALVASPALAAPASLSRSVVVHARPAAVWAAVGPFCAIADWHPAIATCAMDGKTPPTRTLVTREGPATFVERQVARDDAAHRYGYSFVSSPLPVTGYTSTFKVEPSGAGDARVTWSGAYTPDPGQAEAAETALAGIYESGLAAIAARFAATAQAAPVPSAEISTLRVVVRYGDLDLGHAAGERALRRRIHQAAIRACGGLPSGLPLEQVVEFRSCRALATDRALAEVGLAPGPMRKGPQLAANR